MQSSAAAEAFKTWRKTSVLERSKLMRKLHDAILDNQDALAELLTLEQGKSLAESRGEVGMSAAYILWYAEEARRTYGDVVPSPWADRTHPCHERACWCHRCHHAMEFPVLHACAQDRPGACGRLHGGGQARNTDALFRVLVWGALCEEVGIPKGVVNILTGSASEIGGEITSNSLVRKITFTGSTEIGKILIKQAADTVKKVSMELGGNAPFIVFDDADVDRAVDGAIIAKFRNSGQTCVCTNRFLVQSGHLRHIRARSLPPLPQKLKVGNGLEDRDPAGAT